MQKTLVPFLLLLLTPLAGAEPPSLRLVDRVNPVPRPYDGRMNVATKTTFYFEVVVPVENLPDGAIDTDSLSATLTPQGGAPVPVLFEGQVFAPGFSGSITPGTQDAFAAEIGDAVYVVPDTPLDPDTVYTIVVQGSTLDGQPIDPAQNSWTFTTRDTIATPTVSWSVDFADPTVRWEGWFHTGILKPNFNTSRLFDQLDSYALMDEVNAINPDAWSLQRDWPLTSDYWHNGVFDGNPNLVREMETRQVSAVENLGASTRLTLTDLDEGPLYGITPGRPLSGDYQVGDVVTIADREKFEAAEVTAVSDATRQIEVTPLTTPASAWILEYEGSHPPGNPEVPDNFSLPLCYLRKRDPVGTPVYYWDRIDDEWDIVHGTHGRRLQVNFSYTPLDLSREPVPGTTGGHGSISPPKDWLQWHGFVRELVFHLIDRYGNAAEDFYYSVGNENNFSIFWSGGKDGFYELYDYTVNAVLTAFEDRGLDASRVQVGGIEAAGLGGRGWTRDALYHASGAASKPDGGIEERNFACFDPVFQSMLAERVADICLEFNGRGSPLDFVSIHEYEHASDVVSSLTAIRDDALAMDPVFYDQLNVTSFENTPDWIPRTDPASRKMFEGNGYFPTWAAEWVQRMVARAESDPRYARHESVLTVWPFDYNGAGQTSITGLIRVDEDGDGTEDRVATIKKGIFNFIEMLAHLNRDLDALSERQIAGIRFGGVRSPEPDVQRFLVYNHDKYDTESVEATTFTAELEITGVPWQNVTVRRWRLDRDHSSPYNAYQSLPERGTGDVYTPGEINDLEATDDLAEYGVPTDYEVTAGAFQLDLELSINGVVMAEVRERDADGDGRADSMDCDDDNPDVWALPGEPENLILVHDAPSGTTTLTWLAPEVPGGLNPLYDTLRSSRLDDFGDGVCIETDGIDRESTDGETSPAGTAFGYLVRAGNTCGEGSLGITSAGNERSGRACP